MYDLQITRAYCNVIGKTSQLFDKNIVTYWKIIVNAEHKFIYINHNTINR
nr:MAG TPA: hypothetical protein [Caudoviricetes sp.]